ncbi:MAG: glutamyl-tRNA amidotransferase [Gammaproteobacteria bacterium]|nr:glutamyl-tRNA amidotransferase [Gammaproteobacteria bacterium]
MAKSSLKEIINESMKSAMKARDKDRLKTIRLAMSEIKRVEVDTREEQTNSQIVTILDKMVKQRRESIRQFELGGRQELVIQEELEIEVLTEFLPQALSEEEIDSLIRSVIADSKAESVKDMGKVMGVIKPQVIGRADMSVISKKIKSLLA